MPGRFALQVLLLALAVPLAGCDRAAVPEISAIDASGESLPEDMVLTDHTGKPKRLTDYKGKIVALFFGFTQCPAVCPTTLAEFAQVYRQLGPDADQVQVLFVTIDPEQDTQQLLAEFMPTFDPRFIGLRGTAEQTRRVAEAFKVSYVKVPAKAGDYTFDHTTYVFLLDRSGRLRLRVPHGQSAAALVSLIREIQQSP